jgi:hypothetical protein
VPLANLLQSHAGHRFTFALVELAIYESPDPGVRLVIPSVLAQTTLIERGVVRVEGNASGIKLEIVESPVVLAGAIAARRISLGEDEFFELLGQRDANLPAVLRNFLAKADALSVYAEFKGGLNLKHVSPEGQPLNLGTVSKDGFVDTAPSTWWGRKPLGQTYNESLAQRIGGKTNTARNGEESALRTGAGRMPRLGDLLPVHEQAWLDAIEKYVQGSFAKSEA